MQTFFRDYHKDCIEVPIFSFCAEMKPTTCLAYSRESGVFSALKSFSTLRV